MERPNHNTNVCDGCQTIFHGALPECAGPTCALRICSWCSYNGVCADCKDESAARIRFRATLDAREREELLAVLMWSGATVGSAVLPRIGEG